MSVECNYKELKNKLRELDQESNIIYAAVGWTIIAICLVITLILRHGP
jgi:hypothetical protein